MRSAIFHLAFPVADIATTKQFYGKGLGCQVGRETVASVILNLYGNQLVAHVTHQPLEAQQGIYPRHFGLVFTDLEEWEALRDRSQTHQLEFFQQPKQRFIGEITEHRTFFLADPFHNLLEFKHYTHFESVFGAREFGLVGDLS
ncbi:MAG: VOC family protein [Synechococcus sp.]